MKTSIDICKEIKKELSIRKRSVAWLAKELGHEPSSFRKLLKKNDDLPSKLLYQISFILGKDFHAYYTRLLPPKTE